jgi:hypothetical protein
MRSSVFPIALALCLVLSAAARAQGMADTLKSSTPQDRATFQTEYMKDKLALTAEQLPKVSALNLDTAQKMEPILKGDEGPLLKLRAMKGIEAQKETALQGILTPDQFQKFLAMREDMKQKLEQKLADKAAGQAK